MMRIVFFFVFFIFFSISSFSYTLTLLHSSDVSRLSSALAGHRYVGSGLLFYLGSVSHPVAVAFSFPTFRIVNTGSGLKYSSQAFLPASYIVVNLEPSCRIWMDSYGNFLHTSSCSPRSTMLFPFSYVFVQGNSIVTAPFDNFTDLCSGYCDQCSSSAPTSFPDSSEYRAILPLGYCSLDCSSCNDAEKPYCPSEFPPCDSQHSLSVCPYLSDVDEDGTFYRCVYEESRGYYCYYDNSSSSYMCSFVRYVYDRDNGSYVRSVDTPFLSFSPSFFSPELRYPDFAGDVYIHLPTFFYDGSIDYNGCKLSNLYAEIDFDFSISNHSHIPGTPPCLVGSTSIPPSLIIENYDVDNSSNFSISPFLAFNHKNQIAILKALKHIHSSLTDFDFDNLSSHLNFDTFLSFDNSSSFFSLFSSFLASSPFSFDSSHLSLADSYCSLSFTLFSHSVSFSFCSPVVISFLNVVGAFVVVFSSILFFFIAFK